jgi:hypothetical protein
MKKLYISFCIMVFSFIVSAVPAFAAITMPNLPVTDLETAGTAILGLVAVAVTIGVIIRTFRRA